MENQLFYKVSIFIFVFILFSAGISSFLYHSDLTVSQLENRALKTIPDFSEQKLWSGEYFKEFEEYYADTFPFRERLVKVSSAIRAFSGIWKDEHVELVQSHGENLFEGVNELPEANGIKGIGRQDSPEDDNAEVMQGNILVLNDRAMYLYHFNPENSAKYAAVINTFKEKAGPEIKVYSMLIPLQIEFIQNEKYKKLSSPQKYAIQYVYDKLSPDINAVDVYSQLETNADKYIYFRTDNHWTDLGAYFGYVAFSESAGFKPIPLDHFELYKVEDYLGSLHRITLNKVLEKKPDTVEVYKPEISYEYSINGDIASLFNEYYETQQNKYGIFLGGDHALGKITTGTKNGKRIAVIKDSFGNAFCPFLTSHYEEVYVIDPRYIKTNIVDLIKNKCVQEVLFINSVGSTEYSGIAKMLMELTEGQETPD